MGEERGEIVPPAAGGLTSDAAADVRDAVDRAREELLDRHLQEVREAREGELREEELARRADEELRRQAERPLADRLAREAALLGFALERTRRERDLARGDAEEAHEAGRRLAAELEDVKAKAMRDEVATFLRAIRGLFPEGREMHFSLVARFADEEGAALIVSEEPDPSQLSEIVSRGVGARAGR
jgi:hypothetical protein